jgi:hypothetical protein
MNSIQGVCQNLMNNNSYKKESLDDLEKVKCLCQCDIDDDYISQDVSNHTCNDISSSSHSCIDKDILMLLMHFWPLRL